MPAGLTRSSFQTTKKFVPSKSTAGAYWLATPTAIGNPVGSTRVPAGRMRAPQMSRLPDSLELSQTTSRTPPPNATAGSCWYPDAAMATGGSNAISDDSVGFTITARADGSTGCVEFGAAQPASTSAET